MLIEKLLLSLLLTLVLELTFACFWGVKKQALFLLVFANVLTNPTVVLWNHFYSADGYLISILLPETAAIIVEALLIKHLCKNISHPVLLAVCINMFSYSLGVILSYIWR